MSARHSYCSGAETKRIFIDVMQTERTFIDELSYQYRHGGMHIRLIFINTVVFLTIVIGSLITGNKGNGIFTDIFALQASYTGLLHQPWGLFTSIFAHFNFLHFLMNMLFLYFVGRIFLQFFTGRRLLHVYIVGGIVGGLAEVVSQEVIGTAGNVAIVGASGSIMALFLAVAVYRPKLQVNLFGLLPVPLMLIAGLYLLSDLMKIGSGDLTAHFAHLGGALIGFLSVTNLHSSANIINLSESLGQRFLKFFGGVFRPRQKMRVERGGGDGIRAGKTDEQYNIEKKERQKKIDVILDKISKSGYESLTKAEKEFLFSQSKNG